MSILKKLKSLFKKNVDIPKKHLIGDVNGDGVVDVSDLTLLTDIILGKRVPKDEEEWKRADVNKDGVIDVADLTTLTNIILDGKQVIDPYCVIPPVEPKDPSIDSSETVDFHDSVGSIDAALKAKDIKKDNKVKKK